jgi:hypothetical protein
MSEEAGRLYFPGKKNEKELTFSQLPNFWQLGVPSQESHTGGAQGGWGGWGGGSVGGDAASLHTARGEEGRSGGGTHSQKSSIQ